MSGRFPTPQPPPPAASRFDVTVNVIVSGSITLELRSSAADAALAQRIENVTARNKASAEALKAAEDDAPKP